MYKELGFTEYEYICKEIKLCECMRFPMISFQCIEGADREFYNFLRSVQGKKVSIGRISEMYDYIYDHFDKPCYYLEYLGRQLLFPERLSYMCLPFDIISRVEIYLSSIDFRVLNCVSKSFKYEIEFCGNITEFRDIIPKYEEFQSGGLPRMITWGGEIVIFLEAFDLSYDDFYRYIWNWRIRHRAESVYGNDMKYFCRYLAYSVGSNYELIYQQYELEFDSYDAIRRMVPKFQLSHDTVFRKLPLSYEDFRTFRMRILGRPLSVRNVNLLISLINTRDCAIVRVGPREYGYGRYDNFCLDIKHFYTTYRVELVPIVQDVKNKARYGIEIAVKDGGVSHIVMCEEGCPDHDIIKAVCHVLAYFNDVRDHLINPLTVDRATCYGDDSYEYNADSQEEPVYEVYDINMRHLCNECLNLDCTCLLCNVCIRNPCICDLPQQNLFCYVCGEEQCVCVD